MTVAVSDSIPLKDSLPCLIVFAYSDIKVTQNYKLVLFQPIDDEGFQFFIKCSLPSSGFNMMMVAWHFPASGNSIVMSLLFTPFGRHTGLLPRLVFIAKPTPASQHSPITAATPGKHIQLRIQ